MKIVKGNFGNGRGGWEKEFPIIEEYPDCCGSRRTFEIDAHDVGQGWSVIATEKGREPHGYEFKEYSPSSLSEALGNLRDKIRRNLAVRYLDVTSPTPCLSHDVMRGKIVCDQDTYSLGLLVDGRLLSMDDLQHILSEYEGWEFQLSIHD